jgi:hypothetical protein
MIDSSIYKLYYLSGIAGDSFYELDGINDLNLQKNLSYDQHFSLGGIDAAYSVNAPEEIQVLINRSFVNYDNMFDYTGLNPVREFRIYDGNNYYSITNLFLKTYSASFSVGDLPKISTEFISYGSDLKQIEFFDGGSINSKPLDIPKLNSISISGLYDQNLKEKYNIYGFNYSLTINRQPYYSVGQKEPTEVCPILPLQIQISLSSKIPNNSKEIDFSKNDDGFRDFDIIVSGSSSFFKLPIRKSKLINSTVSIASQNTLDVKHDFLGFYGL